MLLQLAVLGALLVAPGEGVSFSGDWEAGLRGAGNWRNLQIVEADRFQRVTDMVRQGRYAVRVEVRPGDDPIQSSGERAEALVMTDSAGKPINEGEQSGTQFYAFSVRLEPGWQAPQADRSSAWAIVFQLHGPDQLKASPSVAVSVQNEFNIAIYGGDLDTKPRHQHYPLSNSSLSPGTWVDLVLKVKYAKDATGSVDVWRRDEGGTEFAHVLALADVPTLQYRSSLGGVGPHYWKHGLYRSKQTSITNVLWLDGLTRGDSFDAVVRAAFGASERP